MMPDLTEATQSMTQKKNAAFTQVFVDPHACTCHGPFQLHTNTSSNREALLQRKLHTVTSAYVHTNSQLTA